MPKYPWGKEEELCAHFMDKAKYFGWTTYPETEGFDILCVANQEVRGPFTPGMQLGIQAKLAANVDVLAQAMPPNPKDYAYRKGPHFYGVLVPYAIREFQEVARRLGILVFQGARRKGAKHARVYEVDDHSFRDRFLPTRLPLVAEHKERCWVPDVRVDYAAGASGPRQITKWKLQSVRLALHAVQQGYLTLLDFKKFGISITRWVQMGWIRCSGHLVIQKRRYNRYQLVEEKKPPHLLYPEVVEALAREPGA